MVKAYVLVVTHPGETHRVAMAMRAIRFVTEVHEVMGPYDIVAEIDADNLSDMPGVLAEQIRQLEGIHSTTSLVAFPEQTASA